MFKILLLFLLITPPIASGKVGLAQIDHIKIINGVLKITFYKPCGSHVDGYLIVPGVNALKVGVAIINSYEKCAGIPRLASIRISNIKTKGLKKIVKMGQGSLPHNYFIENPMGWTTNNLHYQNSPCHPVKAFHVNALNEIFIIRERAKRGGKCVDKREQKNIGLFRKKPTLIYDSFAKNNQSNMISTTKILTVKETQNGSRVRYIRRCDEAVMGVAFEGLSAAVILIRDPRADCPNKVKSWYQLSNVKLQKSLSHLKIKPIIKFSFIEKLSSRLTTFDVKTFEPSSAVMITQMQNTSYISGIVTSESKIKNHHLKLVSKKEAFYPFRLKFSQLKDSEKI